MILYYAIIRYKSGFKSKDEMDIELFESINFEFVVRTRVVNEKIF